MRILRLRRGLFRRRSNGPGLFRPRELDGLGLVGGAVELTKLDEDSNGRGLAVRDVDAELDVPLVGVTGVKAVAPSEPGLALGAGGAGPKKAPADWWPVMRTRQSPMESVFFCWRRKRSHRSRWRRRLRCSRGSRTGRNPPWRVLQLVGCS